MVKLLISLIFSFLLLVTPVFAEVLVDNNTEASEPQWQNSAPTEVWISDTEGFIFYANDADMWSMASTTDGGATWGNFKDADNVNTSVVKGAVWYDRWTPNDTTGTKIHIATLDTILDDSWYTEYDTITNVLSTTVVTGTEAASMSTNNYVAITKTEDGNLFISAVDAADAWTHTCSTTCTSAVNWSAVTNPWTLGQNDGNDYIWQLPVKGTDNMLLSWFDVGQQDLASIVWSATSTSWWGNAWTDIDTTIIFNGTYDGNLLGGTLNKSTGEIYTVISNDVDDYVTEDHDINVWEWDNTTYVWTQKTDVITNASGGLQGTKISVDENTGDLYATYVRRTDITIATSSNIYSKTSTDNGTTWGSESSAYNDTPDDLMAPYVNLMSDERLGVHWRYMTDPFLNDAFFNTVVDLSAEAPTDNTKAEFLPHLPKLWFW